MMNARQSDDDKSLEALLDDALAPEAMPASLADRLVSVSASASAVSAGARARTLRATTDAGAEPQLRFEPIRRGAWPALTAAAVIALTILGVWKWTDTDTTPAPQTVRVLEMERELGELERAIARPFDPLDERIDLLTLHMELTQISPLWPGEGDPLEEAAGDIHTQRLIHESELAWAYY